MNKHTPTPTPWHKEVTGDGRIIATVDGEIIVVADCRAKDTDRIVTAVNNHERLIALLVRWRHFNRYTNSPRTIEAETDALLAELLS